MPHSGQSVPSPRVRRAPPAQRVLIVDDSRTSREALETSLLTSPEVEIVGTAADGGEALQLARQLNPDVILLDLEMPGVDGFSFLKLLMVTQPTPVIVLSSHSSRENAFKALELGATDVIAKPESPAEFAELQELLLRKLRLIRNIKRERIALRPPPPQRERASQPITSRKRQSPRHLVVLGAATGGPAAVAEFMAQFSSNLDCAVVIAQHLPDRFTRTFAERLDRFSSLDVCEATDGAPILAGGALVCPGRSCIEIERRGERDLRVRLVEPEPGEVYVPNIDRLFRSASAVMGRNAIGVVLTGLGEDGVEGARSIVAAEGKVLVESEDQAIASDMPQAVLREGLAHAATTSAELAGAVRRLILGR